MQNLWGKEKRKKRMKSNALIDELITSSNQYEIMIGELPMAMLEPMHFLISFAE